MIDRTLRVVAVSEKLPWFAAGFIAGFGTAIAYVLRDLRQRDISKTQEGEKCQAVLIEKCRRMSGLADSPDGSQTSLNEQTVVA